MAFAPNSRAPLPPPTAHLPRVSARWINPLLGAMLIMICGAVASVLYTAREGDIKRASIEAANISAAITQDIERNLELYDLSIQGALEDVGKPEVMNAPKVLRNLILFDRAAGASFLGKILVLDEHGDIVADSSSLDPKPMNYADRDYFRIQAERPDFGLYVSRPLIARSDGQSILGLSRRINKADGSFGGVVVGSLRLEYFHQLFRKMRLGPNGSLTLLRSDGTVMMREPYDAAQIGERKSIPVLLDLASRSIQGEYEARSAIDGVRRLYHFNRVGRLPLIQDVGLATDDIKAQWLRRAEVIVTVVALCCGLITMLAVSLGRELCRRTEAEAALLELVDKDALTGLANRRAFDRTLQDEWRRAARQGQTLCLLMIDADQFKLYNDSRGHTAGDEVLRRIGRCMETFARRPGELAVRYGGEEFAMILPATSLADARVVAEGLRQAILDLNIPHLQSALGQVSVSIGIAGTVPSPIRLAGDLVADADAALYRSKSAGRNRSTLHGVASEPLRRAS